MLGLFDMRQRDYNPVTGVFLATDPVPVPVGAPFISRYSYGFNNPLVFNDASGVPLPGSPYLHSQLGWRDGRGGSYPQAREFGSDGQLMRDVDFADHGRPSTHANPHEHLWIPNASGGTPARGPAQEMRRVP